MIRRRAVLLAQMLFLPTSLLLQRTRPAAGMASPPPPPVLDLTIIGSADQNPAGGGGAAPVAVRIYQLTATAKFERSDWVALTEHEKETLGQDDAGSEEFVIAPAETRKLNRELKMGVQALGAVVLFRAIDTAAWRVFAPVASSGPSRLTLHIAGTTVTLAPS
jgi:type VI secretion system protein VasD